MRRNVKGENGIEGREGKLRDIMNKKSIIKYNDGGDLIMQCNLNRNIFSLRCFMHGVRALSSWPWSNVFAVHSTPTHARNAMLSSH